MPSKTKVAPPKANAKDKEEAPEKDARREP